MKRALNYIEKRRSLFENHGLFEKFERAPVSLTLPIIVSGLSFWIMTFQDAVEQNELRFEDPDLRVLVGQHRHEELEHVQWFLHDIAQLTKQTPTITDLYRVQTRSSRIASYEIMHEILHTMPDARRLLILETMEATAEAFLTRISARIRNENKSLPKLLYFSQNHLEAEQNHVALDQHLRDIMARTLLDDLSLALSYQMIDRLFDSFHKIMDELNDQVLRRSA